MNRYIQKLIREQFNIGNMDLSNKQKRSINIFNKNVTDPHKIYDKIIKKEKEVARNEIEYLNNFTAAVKVQDTDTLKEIIRYYSDEYKNYSLNWLDVSGINDMSYIFNWTSFNGDIS